MFFRTNVVRTHTHTTDGQIKHCLPSPPPSPALPKPPSPSRPPWLNLARVYICTRGPGVSSTRTRDRAENRTHHHVSYGRRRRRAGVRLTTGSEFGRDAREPHTTPYVTRTIRERPRRPGRAARNVTRECAQKFPPLHPEPGVVAVTVEDSVVTVAGTAVASPIQRSRRR